MPDDDLSQFVFRMLFVVENRRERIRENRHRFVKSNALLPLIRGGFLGVPFKFQIGRSAAYTKNLFESNRTVRRRRGRAERQAAKAIHWTFAFALRYAGRSMTQHDTSRLSQYKGHA